MKDKVKVLLEEVNEIFDIAYDYVDNEDEQEHINKVNNDLYNLFVELDLI